MALINKSTLKWMAPTLNTDGSAISQELSYRLTVDGADFLDFPGTLNPNGEFEQPLAPLNLPQNQVMMLALKAFYVNEPQLISEPSGTLEVILGVPAPAAPFGLAAV
jgi:hypothetical protein